MRSNIHDRSIPEELMDQTLGKVDEAMELLDDSLYSLTPEDRQNLLKMGDKSLAFVEKACELASVNPQFAPSYFNLEELKIDLADAINLTKLSSRLQQFSRKIEDTAMLAGSEAFTQALIFYNSVKQAARDNVPGAQSAFEELKKRFVLGRPKKSVE